MLNRMEKKLSIFSTLFLSSALFGAPNGVYIEAGLGTSLEDTQTIQKIKYVYDRGFSGNVALGYQVNLFRFEVEALYRADKINSFSNYHADGDLTQNSQMFNLYYSGYNSSNLVSTIGLGAGVSSISVENLKQVGTPQDDIENSSIPSYQGMASVGYMFDKHITCTLKYKYLHTSKSDDFEARGVSDISFSLRYLF